ncbi:MAG TPA: hypothetical protein VLA97_00925 [Nocardioidaceae bacterium]|nr:hypothetical protein [Nocardioidaceae bacterium]HSE69289.1 hypothetical protein [Nocardioidaceae bacterium]
MLTRLLWRPWDQSRARENARCAATELARQRVAREEVEIFLERHRSRRRAERSA